MGMDEIGNDIGNDESLAEGGQERGPVRLSC